MTKPWYRQHLTRPCKKRKDGAPAVSKRERKNNSERLGRPPVRGMNMDVRTYWRKPRDWTGRSPNYLSASTGRTVQASLRDATSSCPLPGVETPGYYQESLRDRTTSDRNV